MTTTEKVAYLKGLADGLELGRETKEQKLIAAIIDVLETVAQDLDDLEENALDLGEEIDALSDDLADVEEIIYGDECCCCCGDYDDECCCGGYEESAEGGECCAERPRRGHSHECCGHHKGGSLYEITCPGCTYCFTIDDEVLALGSINCPSCGGVLEFDVSGEEAKDAPEGGGCGCGHHHSHEEAPAGE